MGVKTKLGWVLSSLCKGKNINSVVQSNVSLVLDSTTIGSQVSKKQKM